MIVLTDQVLRLRRGRAYELRVINQTDDVPPQRIPLIDETDEGLPTWTEMQLIVKRNRKDADSAALLTKTHGDFELLASDDTENGATGLGEALVVIDNGETSDDKAFPQEVDLPAEITGVDFDGLRRTIWIGAVQILPSVRKDA